MTKSNLRSNVFVSPDSLQYIIQGSQGGNSRWEPGGRNWRRGLGAVLLNGLIAQPALLYNPAPLPRGDTTYSELDPPVTIINQEDVPKCLSIGQSGVGGVIFSIEFPSSKMTLACIKLT